VHSSDEKMSIRNQSVIAVDSALLGYGTADSVALPRRSQPAPSLSRKAKFFIGELTGLLFIGLSLLYIFAVPLALAKPGAIGLAMNRLMKRTVDIIGATVGLILSAPLMLAVAVAVKLDSPGPIFYIQTRVGVNRRKRGRRFCQKVGAANRRQRDRRREDYLGRPFKMIKFRTMVQDAEKKTGPVWATKNDPRITRIGGFLRKCRLDEFPQFWSVLAQVENGYDSSVATVAEKVRFDLKYIRSWSVWTDVRILLKTVVVVLTGRGAC
jgi:lipopolysaccharide/colanic/teichoic acid biosynthesis glycosyltransferase